MCSSDLGAVVVTPVPELDVLTAVSRAIGAPMAVAGAAAPALHAHSQENEKRCVASAMCVAMMLRALHLAKPHVRALLQLKKNHPSITHAYHTQRRMECEANRRCNCGIGCGELCEDCGSRMTVMLDACKAGIVQEAGWPMAERHNLKYAKAANAPQFLDDKVFFKVAAGGMEWIDVGAGPDALGATLADHLGQGHPVVINIMVYPSQAPFFTKQTGIEPGKSPYDARHLLPAPRPAERPEPIGHAMLVVGVQPELRRIRIRNSAGPGWGFHGDLCMSYDLLVPKQTMGLLAIKEVTLHNAHLL